MCSLRRRWLLLAVFFDPAGGSKKIPGRSAETPANVFITSSKGWEPEKLLRRNRLPTSPGDFCI
ncbi:hypothetical protein CROQUDRAFT_660871 [Cronartium quercuum f. sp. fusiforme G11]|uniref:Secreted protein n=1 Tax=Cronartium quercuum f. sp. fusiforme G11 TaxID=708437 RepID=A0A9P6NBP9_9BASI|nr:hypothetical protein CROQUDRAFT_660871 [Cronartium quercuum f. sp. fusiforme G11]